MRAHSLIFQLGLWLIISNPSVWFRGIEDGFWFSGTNLTFAVEIEVSIFLATKRGVRGII